ncbi:hypothetical protein QN277_008462 [Acacia crassicarpa]|uniref:H/ACA ribonucleoprotein complex non-core subunit NAF1 n=1 Tax=Acacia crassicarpa TaxID=499986 RepID=A0AAE1MD30_9FABA|nr:hypothetical protein QN277_008462 [Acacia crassicarpa]
MADQESNGIGVADTFALVLEDCSFDGLDRSPVVSNDVRKVEERVERENLGISSCMVEQEMRNGAEAIAVESTRVLKVDGEACESLGVSGCNIEKGLGSINLDDGLHSSEQEMRNGAEPITVESTSTAKVDGEVRQKLGASSCNSNIEEGVGSISSVSGLGSSVIIGNNDGKSEIKMDESESESSESESDNPSSPTSASSGSSGDSDDCSTSGGSSDDDDSDEEEKMTKQIEVEAEEGEIEDSGGQELGDTAASDDEDAGEVSWSGINDEDDIAMEGPIRSKNELEDLPSVPPVNVTLEPHHQMLPVGVVLSIVGTQVIVEGTEKHDPLNDGSILWITETRTPLGLVDEIFGPVKNPYYTVRYNSENEIPKGVRVGTLISFVVEFADHVLNNKDLYKKGYDASGLNDEEVSDEAEFSDDEKEAEYRKMHKMMKRGMSDKNHGKQSKHKNNREMASRNSGPAAPPFPVPSSSTQNHEKFPPFSGIRPGPFMVPPFPPPNPGPNLSPNGVWTNGMSLMQPQTGLLPNGFLPNGISLFPGNGQNPYQLPMTGLPFQPPLPGTNTFAQPMFYPQGLLGAHPMNFGMNFPQIQASVNGGGQQGSSPYGMQRERNHNFQSGPDNLHAPNQIRPGGSANRGRRNFHQRGRKSWRPTK